MMSTPNKDRLKFGLTQLGKRGLQRVIRHLEQDKPILLNGNIASRDGKFC